MMEFLSKIDKYRLCAKASSIEVLTGDLAEKVDSMLPNTQLLYLGNESNGCPVDNCIVSAYKFADGEHLIECLDIVNKKQYVKTHADADWGSPIGGADAAISNIEFKVTQDGVNAVKLEVLQDGTDAGTYLLKGAGSATVEIDDNNNIIIRTPEYSASAGSKVKNGKYTGDGNATKTFEFNFYPYILTLTAESGLVATVNRGQTAYGDINVEWNEKNVNLSHSSVNQNGKKYYFTAFGVETLETFIVDFNEDDGITLINTDDIHEGDDVFFTVSDSNVRAEHITLLYEDDSNSGIAVTKTDGVFSFTQPEKNVKIVIEAKTKVEDNVTVHNVDNIPYEFSPTQARTNDDITLSITDPDTGSYDYYINSSYGTSTSFKYKQVNTFTLTREEIEEPELEEPDVPPHTHSYTTFVRTDVVGDCVTEGFEIRQCSCGLTDRISTGYGDHPDAAYTEWTKQEATCGQPGKEAGWSCSACEQSDGGAVIPATGAHNYVDGVCTVCKQDDPNYTPPEEPEDPPHNHFWYYAQYGGNAEVHGCACGVTEPHAFDKGVVTKDPTCIVEGVKTYTCTKCDYKKTESISTIEHVYEDGEGNGVFRCSMCGELHPDHKHEYINEKILLHPTCQQAGSKTYYCDCGKEDPNSPYPIAKVDHEYDDSDDGVGYCIYGCGAINPEHTHDYDYTKVIDSFDGDCQNRSWSKYKCKYCDETTTSVGDFGNHDWGETDSTAATCTEDGITYYECGICGETDSTVHTKAYEHSYTKSVTEPTCTEQGYTTHTCSRCGDSYTDSYTGPNGHNESDPEGVIEATCEHEGYTGDTYCIDCNEHITSGETISKKPHTPETVSGTPATCTSSGLTDGAKCSVCGEWITKQTTIPANGHAYEADDNGVYWCAECGELDPDHAHSYTFVETTPASCEEPGEKTGTCPCGATTTKPISALGHDYDFTSWESNGDGTWSTYCQRPGCNSEYISHGDPTMS